MANLMSLKHLRNKVSRNGFDLSRRNLYTAKVGELLPVMVQEVLPGDRFKIDFNWFTRTTPVNTAAFTRFREYYDFYFVPYSLLWRGFNSFISQINLGDFSISNNYGSRLVSQLPYFEQVDVYNYFDNIRKNGKTYLYDEIGQFRYPQTNKLLEYLGYGDFGFGNMTPESDTDNAWLGFANLRLNPFALLAYQKIYQDYYRDSQWESPRPYLWNIDYVVGSNTHLDFSTVGSSSVFDIRYANYNKDLFFGVLPKAQYGDESNVSVGFELLGFRGDIETVDGSSLENGSTVDFAPYSDYTDVDSNFGVLALRKAEALQRWKEISQSGDLNYRDLTKRHWNVDPGSHTSRLCQYLGGTVGTLNINEVVNQNLASDGAVADIAGKGVGSDKGYIDFQSKDYGVMMCIYHCVPMLDYQLGVDPQNLRFTPTDYAIPEFDRIGMESENLTYLLNSNYFKGSPIDELVSRGYDLSYLLKMFEEMRLGYMPRYAPYKTAVDQVRGEFNYSLSHWVSCVNQEMILNSLADCWDKHNDIDYTFFKVRPDIVDGIFAVGNSEKSATMYDKFLCSVSFNVSAVRNLDRDGLPY